MGCGANGGHLSGQIQLFKGDGSTKAGRRRGPTRNVCTLIDACAMLDAMFAFLASTAIVIAQPGAPALPLVCRAEGLKPTSAVTPEKVCARFKAAIEKQTGKKIRLAAAAPDTGDWIRVHIRFSHADTATVTLSQKRRGKLASFPAQVISVSDRKIDMRMVEQIARVVAAQVKLR